MPKSSRSRALLRHCARQAPRFNVWVRNSSGIDDTRHRCLNETFEGQPARET